ncbi:uncharacterized protein LOC133880838 [Alnus glutinosa]|uniref:uncharacterized protein LOC133880838 n=1 Tax=Alnus glutinosa TaxID=3517 RepID=UPI002D78D10A|nr:uncharacterized protein LOC133880838 [Alnus glutinosa]
MEGPPEDDCCAVCHGRFTLPCRTSCSHWFCGDCILQVWIHGDTLKRCRCPICCCYFPGLTPLEASFDSTHDPEAARIMGNVRRYNRVHAAGIKGLVQKMLDLPFFIWMMLQDLMDPDKSSLLLFRVRIFAIILGGIYMAIPIDIIGIDKRNTQNLFEYGAFAFVTLMHIIGLYRTGRLGRHGNRWIFDRHY